MLRSGKLNIKYCLFCPLKTKQKGEKKKKIALYSHLVDMRDSTSGSSRLRSEALRIISCLGKGDKKISFAENIADLLH